MTPTEPAPADLTDPDAAAGASRGRRWLREPLLHFLLIGAVLFMLYRTLNGAGEDAPRSIVVSSSRVDALAENFARTWMRPPSAQELQGLVEDYVAEEVYYREAIAMGLDRDDTVIRRRLRQKMEFVTDDVTSAVPATDAQLQAYLDSHRDQFVAPGKVTFEQVFLSRDKRGDTVERDATQLLERLASPSPPSPLDVGDATLLPGSMRDATPADVDNTFGAEFAEAVMKAPAGQWSGPIVSGYGLHLVRVEKIEPGALPGLAAIRPAVEREWQAQQRRQAKEALLEQLRSKYDVRIEGPLGDAMRAAATAGAAEGKR
jgi:hypothetical protein